VSHPSTASNCRAIVIGAGLAGLYMLYKLRQLGINAVAYEAAADVGGTWYWNRYPGARCDVESLDYQYTFSDELQREWRWSERFAKQPEILSYINYVANRFELKRDIRFNTRVMSASFQEERDEWEIETSTREKATAQFLIAATGCLSLPQDPDLPGLETFSGRVFHTGRWPHNLADFTGRRVAVIGTGSSGIQVIPEIAQQAKHLYVLQRTPNFSCPAQNRPLSQDEYRFRRDNFADIAASNRGSASGLWRPPAEVATKTALSVSEIQRRSDYETWWERGGTLLMRTYTDLLTNEAANQTLSGFFREKIGSIVKDPGVAQLLQPDHLIGTKRICVDTSYYETFNRPNVTLIDIRRSGRIVEVRDDTLITEQHRLPVDDIVFATGYDAMTGPLLAIDIRGRSGCSLREAWAAGPRTYLGMFIAGFPNLFAVAGPGSPSVLANVILSIEQHVEWISDCLTYMRDRSYVRIEARPDAQDAWVDHVNEVAQATLYPRTKSWYLGANIEGKPQVFMPYIGGLGKYARHCQEVAAQGYKGLILARTRSGG